MLSTLAPAEKKNNSKSANSNNKTTQRKVLPSFGKPVQLKGAEEESVQGKFKSGNNEPAVQLVEEEEALQGKFESTNQPAQLVEEEEPLQGKFESTNQPAQLVEEEEPLQGKFESNNQPAQLVEEEEPLQGKFESGNQPAQLVAEEEPLQGKFESGERKSSPNWAFQLKSNIGNSTTTQKSVPQANKTGLPDSLKSGVEQLSGISMDDVKVNYNSASPAQLHAHAYAQGKDIHVAPGQEKHVPHEAWHVVQQKQGRVKATTQLKESVPVNDDKGLENEADVMGAKAVAIVGNENSTVQKKAISNTEVAQLASWQDAHELAASDPQFKKHKPIWKKVEDGTPNAVSTKEDQPPVVDSIPEAIIEPQTEETTDVVAPEDATAVAAPEDATAVTAPEDATAVAAPADATAAVAASPESPFKAKKAATPDIQIQETGVLDYVKMGGKALLTSGATAGEKVTEGLGKNKEITAGLDKHVGIKNPIELDEAAGAKNDISGVVLGGFNAMKDFAENAKSFYEKRDFASGANLLASMADVALKVIEALEKYKVPGTEILESSIPAIGPAISAFKNGIKLFQQYGAVFQLSEKKKEMTKDEQKTVDLYITKINADRISTGIDFALDIANIAGSFFPPAGTIIGLAKSIKSGVVFAMDAYNDFKAGKEKQALGRITGSVEGLSEEEKVAMTDLNGKIKESGNDDDSLLGMINMKMQIESIESEKGTITDVTVLASKNSEQAEQRGKLEAKLQEYNETGKKANADFTSVTFNDIENLATIHKNVILKIIEKAYTEKSIFGRLGAFIGREWGEDKEKIVAKVFGPTPPDPAKIEKSIMELTQGENAAYFWKKTKAAMQMATEGRKYHTKKELQEKTKTILEKYKSKGKITDQEIAKIIY
jgi:uncharacterized protein YbjQ (UPF0145 family)